MRAIVLTRPRQVEVVDNWPEPRLGSDEVLVGMRAVGLCGSDLGVYEGHRVTPALPWVMGHEGGGEILAVGADVTDRHPGQRVVIEPNYVCFACRSCRTGLTSACSARGIVGMTIPGLLAERVAVPARFAWPVPASVSDETLVCVEPLAVARAAVRRAGVSESDECLVLGAGSQGLLVCQALLAIGVRPCVIEPLAGRLALAERIGAKPVDRDGAGEFRVVFDTAGTPETWELALRSVSAAGDVVVIGMSDQRVSLSTMEVTRRQLVIRGSLIYDHPADFGDTVAAVTAGTLEPARVLRQGMPPGGAADAFAQARSARGKSWIDLSGWREARHG
ncbi:L-iditol 2-dehydrogenase [Prauserella marina]|uniref:Alcohol dehydrogenase/L-iditol 2-dehydrogenase n=1 Tax=Prauserella marina TaxID=530584 RepID=A0A222VS13_9PSEU|nr:alcohol dehydrogenase catalytic domain-containing protein [Prauserella marina]ASR36707.1 L-iditol 2-dehydrogenase [Prauserella marina]PWV80417.1 alcohol dehydrogenase/L-iditol 2-dehydrogenase [Prauserella marina]SDD53847.1 alcohol dehydrogenase/L-iditol 2-dehydrogenase [Prauserella marina]